MSIPATNRQGPKAYLQSELPGGDNLSGFFLFLKFFILFPEALNSTRCIDEFLFTGKKRMTFGAYFNPDIGSGRADLDLIATGTSNARFSVFRMYSVFHIICNPLFEWPISNAVFYD